MSKTELRICLPCWAEQPSKRTPAVRLNQDGDPACAYHGVVLPALTDEFAEMAERAQEIRVEVYGPAGSPQELKPVEKTRMCSVEGCDTKIALWNASGRCGKHCYQPNGKAPRRPKPRPAEDQSRPAEDPKPDMTLVDQIWNALPYEIKRQVLRSVL